MADWYVSSVAYTAVTQWAALTTLAVGAIRRQLTAPSVGNERCFRVSSITTGITGASEPTWVLTKAATTTDSGVTWTEITGNSTYNWTAPAARLTPIFNSGSSWAAGGDRVFVSSDHAETQAATLTITSPSSTGATNPCTVISVSRAGSVPPVVADITNGASVTTTGTNTMTISGDAYYQGVTFSCATGSSGALLTLGGASVFKQFYKNCGFVIGQTASGSWMTIGATGGGRFVWDNCTANFAAVGQGFNISSQSLFEWKNTASPLPGSVPTTLFASSGQQGMLIRGVDLSALGSGKTICAGTSSMARCVFENCKLGASVTVSTMPSTTYNNTCDLINCDSGATGYRNEWYRREGTVTTETTITRTGGASDGIQAVSWKTVSNSNATVYQVLELAPISQWNILTGTSHTATIEIVSSASLNNDDIWLELEYLGSSSSPISSGGNSTVATRLTANAAVTTSTAAWNSSPATPVYQKLQVTFTPQLAGLVIARVKLAKPSTTVYVDPLITIV